MNREDRIKLAIKKGITCDPETGKIYGIYGKELTRNVKGYGMFGVYEDGIRYMIYNHQFIYYIVYGKVVEQIDHINGIRDDNRIKNLREVTNQQNQFNKVGTKGYYLYRNGKWKSQISINNKVIGLGYFEKEEEARQAYLNAKKVYHIL